jgi:FKBP-type peptidyl-prolyl cis-trans isomerase FkpA
MLFAGKLRALLPATALIAAGCGQKAADATPPAMTDDQKAIYSYGAAIGQQVGKQTQQLRLSAEELEIFRNGFADTLSGKAPAVEIAQYEKRFQELAEARVKEGAAEAEKKGADFLAAAAQEAGAVKTESGLVYKVLTAGQGARPAAADTVRVHYEGKLTDGKIFDSSRQRGEPAEFALNRVIPCWTEGVQKMQVGEKAQLVCPASIAYGERGAGNDIPPGATLVFEVELLAINGK